MTPYYEMQEHANKHPVTALLPEFDVYAYTSEWQKRFDYGRLSFSLDQWIEDDDLSSVQGLDLLRSFSGNLVVSEKFYRAFEHFDLSFSLAKLTSSNQMFKQQIERLGRFFVLRVEKEYTLINGNLTPMQFWPKLKRFKTERFVIDKKMPTDYHIIRDSNYDDMVIVDGIFVEHAQSNKLSLSFREYPTVPD